MIIIIIFSFCVFFCAPFQLSEGRGKNVRTYLHTVYTHLPLHPSSPVWSFSNVRLFVFHVLSYAYVRRHLPWLLQQMSGNVGHCHREDPWPRMEEEVEALVNDMLLQLQRFREMAHPTVIMEDELFECIEAACEEVEAMRAALNAAVDHPELFAITTDELQARSEKTRAWERDLKKALDVRGRIMAEKERRSAAAVAQQTGEYLMDAGVQGNEFLLHEHEKQRQHMQVDEATLDRLAGGVQRVKETALLVKDELNTQEHVMNDIESGVERAQMQLESAIKKVGRLLDKASDRKKIILIVVLLVILILLVVFVVQ